MWCKIEKEERFLYASYDVVVWCIFKGAFHHYFCSCKICNFRINRLRTVCIGVKSYIMNSAFPIFLYILIFKKKT